METLDPPPGFYIWPNPAFPFRHYLDHPKGRIFIIENIQHNWHWFRDWRAGFRDTDRFLVYCGGHHPANIMRQVMHTFDALQLPKAAFTMMANAPDELERFRAAGLNAQLLNHNAWLDEDLVMRHLPASEKQFDAIYVGRRTGWKRHMLAAKVNPLAIVAGINHGNAISPIPPDTAYLNTEPLSQEQVCEKINQAHCGLILSPSEGACFASSEYLLCGVPVVSTRSNGGRDVWYNDYNARICDDTPDSVAEAVAFFKDNPRDPHVIRNMHITQSRQTRWEFIQLLDRLFTELGITDIDPVVHFHQSFIHKLRRSIRPDFATLFPH